MQFLSDIANVIGERKIIDRAQASRAAGATPSRADTKALRQALVGAFEQFKRSGDFKKLQEIREALGEPLTPRELSQLQAISDSKFVDQLVARVQKLHDDVVRVGTSKDIQSDETLLWQIDDGDILKFARQRALPVPVSALETAAETQRWRPLIETLDRSAFHPNDVLEPTPEMNVRQRSSAMVYLAPERVVKRLDTEPEIPRAEMLKLLSRSIAHALNRSTRQLDAHLATANPFFAGQAQTVIGEIESRLALATQQGFTLASLAEEPVGMGGSAKPRILGLAHLEAYKARVAEMAAYRDELAAGPKTALAEWRSFSSPSTSSRSDART